MVLMAPSDGCYGHCWFQSHCTGLQRLWTIRPITRTRETTFSDFVGDLLAIFDAMDIPKVFVVAKDFGVKVASLFALLHRHRVSGIVTLGGPLFTPGNRPSVSFPEGCYVSRWQEPSRAEADFARFDVKTVVRNIYILFAGNEVPTAEENTEIMDLVDQSTPLPPWFSEEDLAVYGSLYEKSGFTTALKVPYRSMNEEFHITNPRIEVPALMIIGERDYCLKFPGVEDCVRSERVKAWTDKLEKVFLPEGKHFAQEQFPEQVNRLILDFLGNHK